jgi:hypothetical protein
MRILFFIGLCIISTACNNGDSYRRGYVITQSQETAVETETVTEPLSE